MRDMTVGELIERLSSLPDETPIRLAFQPSWPLQFHLSNDIRIVRGTCYLSEGAHPSDTPYAPRDVFSECLEDPECAGCSRLLVAGSVEGDSGSRDLICLDCLKIVDACTADTFEPIDERDRSYAV